MRYPQLRHTRLIALGGLAALLGGCGQKGGLYLPDSAPAKTAPRPVMTAPASPSAAPNAPAAPADDPSTRRKSPPTPDPSTSQ